MNLYWLFVIIDSCNRNKSLRIRFAVLHIRASIKSIPSFLTSGTNVDATFFTENYVVTFPSTLRKNVRTWWCEHANIFLRSGARNIRRAFCFYIPAPFLKRTFEESRQESAYKFFISYEQRCRRVFDLFESGNWISRVHQSTSVYLINTSTFLRVLSTNFAADVQLSECFNLGSDPRCETGNAKHRIASVLLNWNEIIALNDTFNHRTNLSSDPAIACRVPCHWSNFAIIIHFVFDDSTSYQPP